MKRSIICWLSITTALLFSPPTHALLPTLKAANEALVNDFNHRSATFLLQKDYASAAANAEFAIETAEPNLGENHPAIALSRRQLFEAYRALKQYDKAEKVLLRSIRITETDIGKNHLNLVPSLNDLADLYLEQKQYEKAESIYLRQLNILEESVGASHPNTILILEKLAAIYTAQGNSEKAQQFLDRINALHKKTRIPSSSK
jgi:tetratricopeptide (TPR) repeat protein